MKKRLELNRFGLVNAQKHDLTVGMLHEKTVPMTVSSLQLSVQRTLEQRLQGRVQHEAKFHRPKMVFKCALNHIVNRVLGQVNGSNSTTRPVA